LNGQELAGGVKKSATGNDANIRLAGVRRCQKKCASGDDCRGTWAVLLFPNSHACAHNVKSGGL